MALRLALVCAGLALAGGHPSARHRRESGRPQASMRGSDHGLPPSLRAPCAPALHKSDAVAELLQLGAYPSQVPCQERGQPSPSPSPTPGPSRVAEVIPNPCDCSDPDTIAKQQGLRWVSTAIGDRGTCSADKCLSALLTYAVESKNPDRACTRRCQDEIQGRLRQRCSELQQDCQPKPREPECRCATKREVMDSHGSKWLTRALHASEPCSVTSCVDFTTPFLVASPARPDSSCVNRCRQRVGAEVEMACRELAYTCKPKPKPISRPPPRPQKRALCNCAVVGHLKKVRGPEWLASVGDGDSSCDEGSCYEFMVPYFVESRYPDQACKAKCARNPGKGVRSMCALLVNQCPRRRKR